MSVNPATDLLQLFLTVITAEEAEERILRYMRERPGHLVKEWAVLNKICDSPQWEDNRLERKFFLKQVNRLIQEGKIIRYRRKPNRGCIRISEAYA